MLVALGVCGGIGAYKAVEVARGLQKRGHDVVAIMTASATLVDLSLRYDLGRRFSNLQGWTTWLNVSNLLDRKYFASCTGANYCYWGQGRLLLAGAKYQW